MPKMGDLLIRHPAVREFTRDGRDLGAPAPAPAALSPFLAGQARRDTIGMSHPFRQALVMASPRGDWRSWAQSLATPATGALLLFAAIGVEAMVLTTWLPDTIAVWLHPERTAFGDFEAFYRNASNSHTTNLYSPGLTFLLKPLTWLSIGAAFRIYAAINAAALLGVAYLAQRGVHSPAARVAVFLGVIALPQAQWVLRLGHFTPVLALLALGGLLLTERRPVLAGVLIALLALKPQYLPAPLLYLAWTRNGRALLGAGGTLVALGVAGLVAVGFDSFWLQARSFFSMSLDHGQILLPGQQAWQYSWQGFLISAGLEPNLLLTVDLLLLSLAVVALTWAKATPPAAKVAAALGMLLLAPYATFYNWMLIAVAGALLLRSGLRPAGLVPTLLAGGALAAAATQANTPFPSPDLLVGGTDGLYWLPPFALAALAVLALAGRRQPSKRPAPAAPTFAATRSWRPAKAAGWALGALGAMAGAFALSAYVAQSGPFQVDAFGRTSALRSLPDDFPLPERASVDDAGPGTLLPYRVEWEAEQPVSEVAGLMRQRLDDGRWEIALVDEAGGSTRLRALRLGPDGQIDVFAELNVEESPEGSHLTLQYTPLPVSAVPGFQEWLDKRDEAAGEAAP